MSSLGMPNPNILVKKIKKKSRVNSPDIITIPSKDITHASIGRAIEEKTKAVTANNSPRYVRKTKI